MCWVERICLVVPLNLGCVLLGLVNIIVAIAMTVVSILHFTTEVGLRNITTNGKHVLITFGIEMNKMAFDIVAGLSLLLAILWIVVSVMLIVGIIGNKSSCILAYFLYGIVMTIFCELEALLLILNRCWVLPLILILASVLYIYFLVAVYTVYELMQRGKDFRFRNVRDDDTDSLITELDF